jgi:hemerythrin-like domain-containing protein
MPANPLPTVFDVLLQTTRPRPVKMEARLSPAEDLLQAHGLAERILLAYERMIKDWKVMRDLDPEMVNRTAQIAKACLSGCHERNEELWLFPLFREEGYLESLVAALEEQHAAGREVTDQILDLSAPGRIKNETQANMLMTLCRSYVFMYRPHISREDSELFPKLSRIASPEAMADIARNMGTVTRDALGEEGYAPSFRALAEIEQVLEIDDVRGYTIGYG